MRDIKSPWPGLLKKSPVIQVYEVCARVEKAFMNGDKAGFDALEKARRHGKVMAACFPFATELAPHIRPNLSKRGGRALLDGMEREI